MLLLDVSGLCIFVLLSGSALYRQIKICFFLFTSYWMLACFHVSYIMNKAAMNVCKQVFVWTYFHFSRVNMQGWNQ